MSVMNEIERLYCEIKDRDATMNSYYDMHDNGEIDKKELDRLVDAQKKEIKKCEEKLSEYLQGAHHEGHLTYAGNACQ